MSLAAHPNHPLDSAKREVNEADVLRFHYTLLAIAIAPASASPHSLTSVDAQSDTSFSSGASSASALLQPDYTSYRTTPDISLPRAIDPALLLMDLEEDAEELGRLARAIVGSPYSGTMGTPIAIGKASVKKGEKGLKKRARLSEVIPASNSTAGPSTPSTLPKRKKTQSLSETLLKESHISHINSTPQPTTASSSATPFPSSATQSQSQPTPITSAQLLNFKPPTNSRLHSLLPQHSINMGDIPYTPRSGGMEIDELSTPFEPTLFGKSASASVVKTPTGGNGGRSGGKNGKTVTRSGLGRMSANGWMVGTPGAPSGT